MKLWVVYQLVDGGGTCGHTYFLEETYAQKWYDGWKLIDSWNTIIIEEIETED